MTQGLTEQDPIPCPWLKLAEFLPELNTGRLDRRDCRLAHHPPDEENRGGAVGVQSNAASWGGPSPHALAGYNQAMPEAPSDPKQGRPFLHSPPPDPCRGLPGVGFPLGMGRLICFRA